MQYVLVSACLLGSPVRYNGGDKRCDSAVLARWLQEGRVVPVCPEVAGGLPVPRPPAEVEGAAGAARVLQGAARVVDIHGRDATAQFLSGARQALRQAELKGIRVAVLKEGSPSCGSGYTYDGTFTATRVAGPGVTAALLLEAGIEVFSEAHLAAADARLRQLEGAPPPAACV